MTLSKHQLPLANNKHSSGTRKLTDSVGQSAYNTPADIQIVMQDINSQTILGKKIPAAPNP